MNYLTKRFLIDVWANGAATIRERGAPANGGLPVFSTDTREQAERLLVRHCRLSNVDHRTYYANDFSGEIDDLRRLTTLFAATVIRAA